MNSSKILDLENSWIPPSTTPTRANKDPSPTPLKLGCPHLDSLNFKKIISHIKPYILKKSCEECDVFEDNWLCLKCMKTFCSRNSNSHIQKHIERKGRKIALSIADSSFWCFHCNASVLSKDLEDVAKQIKRMKNLGAPEDEVSEVSNKREEENKKDEKVVKKDEKEEEIDELVNKFQGLSTKNKKKGSKKVKFTREELVDGLKNKTFKKVILLTGAGISVSAGIPDFRSPGTGLYANLQKYKLPEPEAVFDLKYFKKNPQPFYMLSKELFGKKVKPVITHHFLKMLADEGMLKLNFTQNIDGLEVEAGVDPNYLVEAHGHSRTAHCIACKKEASIKLYFEHVDKQTIHKCECNGLIKPDIVFFGEDLPIRFFKKSREMDEADLVIVMGTSLMVFPFAELVDMVPKSVPLVYINRENTQIKRDNFLFLEGNIDMHVNSLIRDIGWEHKLNEIPKEEAKL